MSGLKMCYNSFVLNLRTGVTKRLLRGPTGCYASLRNFSIKETADVKIEQGVLEGEQLEVVTGDKQYYSFKGIPYAKPPLGKLRFKAPEPPLPWKGVRKATEHGSVCVQLDVFTNKFIPGSEDCLYLNVYSPNLNPQNLLPVMFFIHGGGYKSGSGNVDEYGPDFLVSQDVVVVTINYRLEALGFLCLETGEVPGNAGLKDQVAALQWVQKNITSFGGDPNNVTVFGESAGGGSTALHVLSPMSKGLFKRAIAMSGVPFCNWSYSFEPKRRAFLLGKQLGIETSNTEELLNFLQDVPVEKLVDVNPFVLTFEEKCNGFQMYNFTPVVEKDFGRNHFLTENMEEKMKLNRINDVDLMMGYTSEEALLALGKITENSDLIEFMNKNNESLLPRKILANCTPGTILQLSDRIHKHYFNEKPISLDTIKELIQLISHNSFVRDIHKYANLYAQTGRKMYLYKFSCISDRTIFGNEGAKYGIEGAAHLDDLWHVFDPKMYNLKTDINSPTYKMVQQTVALFTNFARYGNPTPDTSLGVTWPEYNTATGDYLNIAEHLSTGIKPDADSVEFWNSIYESAGVP